MDNVELVATRHGSVQLGNENKEWLKNRERPVTVTWKDLSIQFHNQCGKCYWFGIPLNPDDIFKPKYPLAMSVDRLDNSRGYEKDNIVICSRMANLGRGNCSAEEFKKIIDKLVNPKTNKWIIYPDE